MSRKHVPICLAALGLLVACNNFESPLDRLGFGDLQRAPQYDRAASVDNAVPSGQCRQACDRDFGRCGDTAAARRDVQHEFFGPQAVCDRQLQRCLESCGKQ